MDGFKWGGECSYRKRVVVRWSLECWEALKRSSRFQAEFHSEQASTTNVIHCWSRSFSNWKGTAASTMREMSSFKSINKGAAYLSIGKGFPLQNEKQNQVNEHWLFAGDVCFQRKMMLFSIDDSVQTRKEKWGFVDWYRTSCFFLLSSRNRGRTKWRPLSIFLDKNRLWDSPLKTFRIQHHRCQTLLSSYMESEISVSCWLRRSVIGMNVRMH